MALVPLEIPKVGLVMENARLVRWLKTVGDLVKQGDPLLELETEKSIVEIESSQSGRLAEILLQVDQEVRVGDRIAWLEVESPRETQPVTPKSTAAHSPRETQPVTPKSAAAQTSPPAEAGARIRSSPVARRLAAEHSLDLSRVTGSGPRGRVQLVDVRRAIEEQPTRPALSSMRRAVARSMTLSNATVPQFIVERAVDWTIVQRLRTQFAADLPAEVPRPSVTDFLLQGIARALLEFRPLNATFSGEPDSPNATIIPASGTHIGLVVSLEGGLLVPVFHDVEQLGLAELARRRAATVERALQGRLKHEDLEGATFSLSNLGARGPERFTALINPPQAAILAVGRQQDRVVALRGEIVVRPMSELTLTVDHRIADGRLASDFLARLVDILESNAWS